MNRYPLWKYIVIVVALLIGAMYTLPNFFGESPAVQVSSGKPTVKVDAALMSRVEALLRDAKLETTGMFFDTTTLNSTIRARFRDTDVQLQAKDALQRALNPSADDPSYIVALNLISNTPAWLKSLHALPMYLGLDLRGGVHFLLQVDMRAAVDKRLETFTSDIRTLLREKNIRHSGISKSATEIEIKFRDAETRARAEDLIRGQVQELTLREEGTGAELLLFATLSPAAQKEIQNNALKQNITTLHNRVNELGVAEPVIQQQGLDRVVVQLPGVQDTAKAKDIIGRTATLEVRMVNESAEAREAERGGGSVPFGSERFLERNGAPIIVLRQVILTGENLTDAQAGFDGQTQEPAVHLTLDAKGARIFRDVTRESIGKRMAILLFEKGKGEVVTAPVIRSEIGGGRVQISGRMTTQEANDQALLLRAGSLAAPMEIIEERTIGPSLGKQNIEQGFLSTVIGFVGVLIFTAMYYRVFGLIADLALAFNLVMIIAILSLLQATLTLPGIAGIVLTIGMAVDANVLIYERIREELRNGNSPQASNADMVAKATAAKRRPRFSAAVSGLATSSASAVTGSPAASSMAASRGATIRSVTHQPSAVIRNVETAMK